MYLVAYNKPVLASTLLSLEKEGPIMPMGKTALSFKVLGYYHVMTD
jgi:energy-converting hydrogenase Eha subunit A